MTKRTVLHIGLGWASEVPGRPKISTGIGSAGDFEKGDPEVTDAGRVLALARMSRDGTDRKPRANDDFFGRGEG